VTNKGTESSVLKEETLETNQSFNRSRNSKGELMGSPNKKDGSHSPVLGKKIFSPALNPDETKSLRN
jgi:hypothetical protein